MKVFNIFIKFLFSKKIFSLPKKKDVLLYDRHGLSLIEKLFNKDQIEIVDTRYESINLIILFKNIINFKFKKIDYILSYIEQVDPKIVVTYNENYPQFYKIANETSKKTLAIQRSMRSFNNDIFQYLEDNTKKNGILSATNFFCFNNQAKRIYEKYIKSNYEIIGCPISNFHLKKNLPKKKQGIYISMYKAKNKFIDHKFYPGTSVDKDKFIASETKFIKFLSNYCKNNNLELNILGKLKVNQEEENNYFTEILKNENFNFIKNHNERPTFDLVDSAEFVIGCTSTLLYQSISRGNKTIFCGFIPDEHPFSTMFFGRLSNYPDIGSFWSNKFDFQDYKKILDRIRKISFEDWKKEIKKHNPEIFCYDINNLKLKKYFKNLGLTTK